MANCPRMKMLPRIVSLFALLILLNTMAFGTPARTVPARAIALHVSGGIEGLDEWVIVKADGTVVVADRKSERVVRNLSPSQLAQLQKAFDTAGFFQWKSAYGGPTAADGMTRTLFYDDGKRKKSVSWTDPGTPPAAFDTLMKRMNSLGVK